MKFLELFKKDKTVRLAFFGVVFLWSILAFVVVFGFVRYYNIYFDERQKDISNVITPILRDYSSKIDLYNTHFNEQENDISKEHFLVFTSKLFEDDESIEAIFVSPSGVIEYVYPESAEELYLDYDMIEGFSPSDLTKFNASLLDSSIFVTYYYYGNKPTDFIVNKPILDNETFVALASIIVDIEKFVDYIPEEYLEREFVIYTEDDVFLIESSNYNVDDYKAFAIEVDGFNYYLATNYHGENYTKTILVCILIMFVITIPLVVVFIIFYSNQKRINDILANLDYNQKYHAQTGLKNINSFYFDIEKLIENKSKFFLSFGVFNNIKFINDKYGHEIGSGLIKEAVTLINGVLREHTELYHYGGDEYVIVIKTESRGEVNNIMKRVIKVFDRDIVIERVRTNISLSAGVVSFPYQGKTIDELIKNAHLTLASSQIVNRNAFAFYEKDQISGILMNQEMDNFVNALNLEMFEVYLMPIVDCKSNNIVGFECLTRAFNDFNEPVDTESVVNSLERNGRIQELDQVVFMKMLKMLAIMNERFPKKEFFLSVNASALSFNEDYVNNVIAAYKKQNFTKGTIVLELTESYRVEDYDYLIRLFKRLNDVGIKTAIDDFGSGYSSLSYISKFPVFAIKLDKTYVRDYYTNKFNRTLFMTLRSIAKVLDCKLVAEGVDDPETLDFLRINKCELYQGFLYSKGVPFDDAMGMIEENIQNKIEE